MELTDGQLTRLRQLAGYRDDLGQDVFLMPADEERDAMEALVAAGLLRSVPSHPQSVMLTDAGYDAAQP